MIKAKITKNKSNYYFIRKIKSFETIKPVN